MCSESSSCETSAHPCFQRGILCRLLHGKVVKKAASERQRREGRVDCSVARVYSNWRLAHFDRRVDDEAEDARGSDGEHREVQV